MFIPIGDDNYGRRLFPFFVFLIVGINSVVWFYQLQLGEAFTFAYSVVPYEISHGLDLKQTVLASIGTHKLPLHHQPGPSPIYLTLITSMFMHGSWLHIIGNMVYLLIFGDQIEDRLGHLKFLIFYLLCGVLGGLAQVGGSPDSVVPGLGASGAIAGVLGAYLVIHPQRMVKVMVALFPFGIRVLKIPAIIVLGLWIVIQVLGQTQSALQEAGGIAYLAHIGGFVAGVVLIVLFGRKSS